MFHIDIQGATGDDDFTVWQATYFSSLPQMCFVLQRTDIWDSLEIAGSYQRGCRVLWHHSKHLMACSNMENRHTSISLWKYTAGMRVGFSWKRQGVCVGTEGGDTQPPPSYLLIHFLPKSRLKYVKYAAVLTSAHRSGAIFRPGRRLPPSS